MAGNRTLKLSILADVDDLRKKLGEGSREVQTFGSKLADFGKKAGVVLAAVGAAASAMAIKIGKESIQAASDLAESTSKIKVIFGASAEDIQNFAASAAKSLGQTRTQAQDAAATFATFGKAAGLTGKDLTKFSTEFVKLASDIASFNNTSVDQAITALGASLRGESEPMRAYGVLLNDATLKAKALEMGIYSGTGTLTAQQKVLAAHQVVLSQTKDAQGDFARTADGMANSQKILTARLEEAKITLGQALLPIALQVVTLFNDKFLPVIENIAGAFSNANGSGLSEKVKQFAEVLQKIFSPIIEGIISAFNSVKKSLNENNDELSKYFTVLKEILGFLNKFFVPMISNTLKLAFQALGKVLAVIINSFSTLANLVANTYNGIKQIIKLIAENPIVQKITGAVGGLFGGGKAAGGPVSAGTTYLVGEKGPELFTPARGGTIIPNGAGGGQTININVSGAIDPISTARQIAQILGYEATASGSFSNLGGSRVFA